MTVTLKNENLIGLIFKYYKTFKKNRILITTRNTIILKAVHKIKGLVKTKIEFLLPEHNNVSFISLFHFLIRYSMWVITSVIKIYTPLFECIKTINTGRI